MEGFSATRYNTSTYVKTYKIKEIQLIDRKNVGLRHLKDSSCISGERLIMFTQTLLCTSQTNKGVPSLDIPRQVVRRQPNKSLCTVTFFVRMFFFFFVFFFLKCS